MSQSLPSRRALVASAAAVPLLLAATGCRTSQFFAGPDPLGSPPPLPHDAVVLESAITAEARLIALYRAVVTNGQAGRSTLLVDLLSQHEQHLIKLRSLLVIPHGSAARPPVQSVPPPAPPLTAARLRAAEQASADWLTSQLTVAGPGLAQVFASIAASDSTHASTLGAA